MEKSSIKHKPKTNKHHQLKHSLSTQKGLKISFFQVDSACFETEI